MPIYWRGLGWLLIPVAAAIAFFVPGYIAFQIDPVYTRAHSWFYGVGCFVVGIGLIVVGNVLNKGVPRRLKFPEFGGNHHLMFLRVEYWGLIFALGGGVSFVLDLLAGDY